MEDKEIKYLSTASFCTISSYRYKVVRLLKDGSIRIPTEICIFTGIRMNHISKVLGELKEHDVVECINEDARKGRLYRLTEFGMCVANEYMSF